MGSGGDGGGITSSISNSLSDIGDSFKKDPIGTLTQYLSGSFTKLGAAKFTPGQGGLQDSKLAFSDGFMVHGIDETVGQVSGRNTARFAQTKENEALSKAQADYSKAQADQQLQNYRKDLMASRTAQAIRDTASAKSGGLPTSGTSSTLGSDEKTVLGV